MASDGARVEVHIEKCRGASGEALDPMEATLESHAAAALWSWRAVEITEPEPRFDARALQPELKTAAEHALLDGLTVAEAARLSGVSVGTAGRIRRQMVEEGRLKGRSPAPHSTSQEP